jgi:hypothetical protein
MLLLLGRCVITSSDTRTSGTCNFLCPQDRLSGCVNDRLQQVMQDRGCMAEGAVADQSVQLCHAPTHNETTV